VFLREHEVEQRTGLSTSQRDRLEAAGEFPRRVPIAERAVGWIEHEIVEWQLKRIATREDAAQAERARIERTPLVRRQHLQLRRQQGSAELNEENAAAGNFAPT
jgi:prophage regulatory protein